MKLKVDDAGNAVLVDGKPVYVADDGKEYPIDGGQLYGRVRDLTTENANHRRAKDEAEAKLKPFEGIADPAAALKALETVANIDAGKLLEAGKVEDIKRQAREAAQAEVATAQKEAKDQIASITAERDTIQGQLHGELIGGGFARSKFITDKAAIPAEMLQSYFGQNFKIEDGKVVGYVNGQKVVSSDDFVSPAAFDVALERMVEASPLKDSILKGQVGAGGGAGNGGGGAGGTKTMARSAFEKLPPTDQMAKMKDGFTLTEA
jgi:hypothetical protein